MFSRQCSRGGSVIIIFNRTMELQIARGNHKAAGYVELFQRASLLTEDPCLCFHKWVFQQDNAAVHYARLTKDFFQENNVSVLDHNTRCPELNPTENFWGWMTREVKNKKAHRH